MEKYVTRCNSTKDFEGEAYQCGRELGHDGLHRHLIDDERVLTWKTETTYGRLLPQ